MTPIWSRLLSDSAPGQMTLFRHSRSLRFQRMLNGTFRTAKASSTSPRNIEHGMVRPRPFWPFGFEGPLLLNDGHCQVKHESPPAMMITDGDCTTRTSALQKCFK